MFTKDYSLWHAICLRLGVIWQGARVHVGNWFDLFHDHPGGVSSRVARRAEIPGRGSVTVVRLVDCLGAMCPRPQLLTMKVLGEVAAGEIIEVMIDNPTAVEGFPALAQTLGCEHLGTVRDSDRWRVYLRKSGFAK